MQFVVKGYLMLKGPVHGCTRSEYEYEIHFDSKRLPIKM